MVVKRAPSLLGGNQDWIPEEDSCVVWEMIERSIQKKKQRLERYRGPRSVDSCRSTTENCLALLQKILMPPAVLLSDSLRPQSNQARKIQPGPTSCCHALYLASPQYPISQELPNWDCFHWQPQGQKASSSRLHPPETLSYFSE